MFSILVEIGCRNSSTMFNLERAGSRHLKFYADCSELHELEFKELRRIIKHLFNSSHDSDQMSELKIFDIYLYFGTETPKNLSDVNRMKTEIAEYITKFSLKLGVPKSNLRINFQVSHPPTFVISGVAIYAFALPS